MADPSNGNDEAASDKPERSLIEYPCEWEYRVIGTDPDVLRRAVAEVITGSDYTLREANHNGKYLSMSLAMNVRDEEHRDHVHRELSQHVDVRLVF